MFAVLFEVQPDPARADAYLGFAAMLRPELEQVDGFVDNLRYRSLTRPGWLLSLSSWRDEKALVRWRSAARHHDVQAQGRAGVLRDYRLRVGELAADTRPPAGHVLRTDRLDETAVGAGTAVVLVDAHRPASDGAGARAVALGLGLPAEPAAALVAWDVFDAVLAPGDVVLMLTLRDAPAAEAFTRALPAVDGRRVRRVRVIREYGLHDRREAPQYHAPAA